MLNNLYSPVNFWTSLRWVLILPRWYYSECPWCPWCPWCLQGSHRNQSSLWWHFPWSALLNFLIMIDWLSFILNNFTRWAGIHKRNRLDETFPMRWSGIIIINMVAVLMISVKLATLGLLKIKLFWNKGYDVILFLHVVTNKILSRDLNTIADVVEWPSLLTLAFL